MDLSKQDTIFIRAENDRWDVSRKVCEVIQAETLNSEQALVIRTNI
jgi:hypothetical protein